MSSEIVQYHDITRAERGNQDLFTNGQEFTCGCPTRKGRKSGFSVQTDRRQNGRGLRRIQQCVIYHPLPAFPIPETLWTSPVQVVWWS